MKKSATWTTAALAGLALLTLGGMAAPGVLTQIERGNWELRRAPGGLRAAPVARLCVTDPAVLAQIEHGTRSCRQFVVSDRGNTITISYQCGGSEQGLTTIRRETSGLLQIQTQGIKDGNPFAEAYEARHTGACAGR